METISIVADERPLELTLAPNLLGVGSACAPLMKTILSKGSFLFRNEPSVIRPIHHVKQRPTNHRLVFRLQLLVRPSGHPFIERTAKLLSSLTASDLQG